VPQGNDPSATSFTRSPTRTTKEVNQCLLGKKPMSNGLCYGTVVDKTFYSIFITVTNLLFFFTVVLPAHSGRRPLIQFRNHFSQTVGLLGRVISPSQGLYLNTGQHKDRINGYTKYPCLEWDSNPRSQRPSERRQFIP
jgi:hypothetical protein